MTMVAVTMVATMAVVMTAVSPALRLVDRERRPADRPDRTCFAR
nr:hypothetical protein [Mesorhizobium prunaredense]